MTPTPCQHPDNAGIDWHSDNPTTQTYAARLCAPCPIRDACEAGARDRREKWGVWGGVLFGRHMWRGQGIGKPGRPTEDDRVDALTREGLTADQIARDLRLNRRSVVRARGRNRQRAAA